MPLKPEQLKDINEILAEMESYIAANNKTIESRDGYEREKNKAAALAQALINKIEEFISDGIEQEELDKLYGILQEKGIATFSLKVDIPARIETVEDRIIPGQEVVDVPGGLQKQKVYVSGQFQNMTEEKEEEVYVPAQTHWENEKVIPGYKKPIPAIKETYQPFNDIETNLRQFKLQRDENLVAQKAEEESKKKERDRLIKLGEKIVQNLDLLNPDKNEALFGLQKDFFNLRRAGEQAAKKDRADYILHDIGWHYEKALAAAPEARKAHDEQQRSRQEERTKIIASHLPKLMEENQKLLTEINNITKTNEDDENKIKYLDAAKAYLENPNKDTKNAYDTAIKAIITNNTFDTKSKGILTQMGAKMGLIGHRTKDAFEHVEAHLKKLEDYESKAPGFKGTYEASIRGELEEKQKPESGFDPND